MYETLGKDIKKIEKHTDSKQPAFRQKMNAGIVANLKASSSTSIYFYSIKINK